MGLPHLGQLQKVLNATCLRISVQALTNALGGRTNNVAARGKGFQCSLSQQLVTPPCLRVSHLLLASFPFLISPHLVLLFDDIMQPQCIHYSLNKKSVLRPGSMPARECKDERHQRSNGLPQSQHGLRFILFNPHNNTLRQAL